MIVFLLKNICDDSGRISSLLFLTTFTEVFKSYQALYKEGEEFKYFVGISNVMLYEKLININNNLSTEDIHAESMQFCIKEVCDFLINQKQQHLLTQKNLQPHELHNNELSNTCHNFHCMKAFIKDHKKYSSALIHIERSHMQDEDFLCSLCNNQVKFKYSSDIYYHRTYAK